MFTSLTSGSSFWSFRRITKTIAPIIKELRRAAKTDIRITAYYGIVSSSTCGSTYGSTGGSGLGSSGLIQYLFSGVIDA